MYNFGGGGQLPPWLQQQEEGGSPWGHVNNMVRALMGGMNRQPRMGTQGTPTQPSQPQQPGQSDPSAVASAPPAPMPPAAPPVPPSQPMVNTDNPAARVYGAPTPAPAPAPAPPMNPMNAFASLLQPRNEQGSQALNMINRMGTAMYPNNNTGTGFA